jgi:hypothetical protein
MVKNFNASGLFGIDFLTITPKYRGRGLCVSNWWENSDRTYKSGDIISYPLRYDKNYVSPANKYILEEEIDLLMEEYNK